VTADLAVVAVLALAVGVAGGLAVARLAPSGRAFGGQRAPARPEAANVSPDRAARDGLGLTGEIAGLAEIGVLRIGAARAVEAANARAHELLGRPRGSLVGLSAIEAFADHRGEEAVERAFDSGEASAELMPHPATRLTVLARARRVDGTVWVALDDVTELRRLQRIRAEFVDNISHELRTPLANVRLLTESLTIETAPLELPERVRESIRKIDVESEALAQMVNELLDLSRIEQGTARLRMEDVDLGVVVRGVIERLRLFAERQGVRVVAKLPADLSHVRGDDERLGQLFLNLLHNAVKFSPPGGTVRVSGTRDGDNVLVSIRDEGPGIPPGDLERVFERFYKVDKARVRGRGGTGLGLAIARHIAETHGGRIWAKNNGGMGAVFTVALPVAPT
jgi:two-component system phosphate regulon sensor histidine kinase PhoR